MKIILSVIVSVVFANLLNAQSLQFTFEDSAVLPTYPSGLLHGISAIEFDSQNKQWHWAADRGRYFVFDSIASIHDFGKEKKIAVTKHTVWWFESIRFDRNDRRFYYAVENEYEPSWENPDSTTYVRYSDTFPPEANPTFLMPPLHLPADNKGIESLAVTDSGNVWVAPESGWGGETLADRDTIHFRKFERVGDGYGQPVSYSYLIDRKGCPNSKTEYLGGISEILSVAENELLVLERCYDEGPGGTNKIKARLWHVVLEGSHLRKATEPAFDFNKGLTFQPDNLEGMAWWPSGNGKKKLLLVTDDNHNRKQQTQIILLQEN